MAVITMGIAVVISMVEHDGPLDGRHDDHYLAIIVVHGACVSCLPLISQLLRSNFVAGEGQHAHNTVCAQCPTGNELFCESGRDCSRRIRSLGVISRRGEGGESALQNCSPPPSQVPIHHLTAHPALDLNLVGGFKVG